METDLIKTLNRVGIIFNFLSFFLVAPEILGEGRLHSLEVWLSKVLDTLVFILDSEATAVLATSLLTTSLGFASACAWVLSAHFTILQTIGVTFLVVVICTILLFIIKFTTQRLLNIIIELEDNSKTRKRSLILGSILFFIGNIAQFAATF